MCRIPFIVLAISASCADAQQYSREDIARLYTQNGGLVFVGYTEEIDRNKDTCIPHADFSHFQIKFAFLAECGLTELTSSAGCAARAVPTDEFNQETIDATPDIFNMDSTVQFEQCEPLVQIAGSEGVDLFTHIEFLDADGIQCHYGRMYGNLDDCDEDMFTHANCTSETQYAVTLVSAHDGQLSIECSTPASVSKSSASEGYGYDSFVGEPQTTDYASQQQVCNVQRKRGAVGLTCGETADDSAEESDTSTLHIVLICVAVGLLVCGGGLYVRKQYVSAKVGNTASVIGYSVVATNIDTEVLQTRV